MLCDGKVFGFGANNDDQLASSSCASSGDLPGVIVSLPTAIPIDSSGQIVEIDCGSSFSLALDSDGKLFGWGSNEDGQLGLLEATESVTVPQVICENVSYFSAGSYHTAIVTKAGKVLTAGESGQSKLGRSGSGFEFRETTLPNEIEKPISVACGGGVTFVACESGNVAVTGSGAKGELGLGTSVRDTGDKFVLIPSVKFKSLSAGANSNSAICAQSGVVYVWGDGSQRLLAKYSQNLYSPRPVKLPFQGVATSNGGLHCLVLVNREGKVKLFPELNASSSARRKRRETRMATSLPPLSRTLDKESLEELRNVMRSQSVKRVKTEDTKSNWTSLDSTITLPETLPIPEPVTAVEPVVLQTVPNTLSTSQKTETSAVQSVTIAESEMTTKATIETIVEASSSETLSGGKKVIPKEEESDDESYEETDDEADNTVPVKKSVEFSPNVTVKENEAIESDEDENLHYGNSGESSQVEFNLFSSLSSSLSRLCSKGTEQPETVEDVDSPPPAAAPTAPPAKPPKTSSCTIL